MTSAVVVQACSHRHLFHRPSLDVQDPALCNKSQHHVCRRLPYGVYNRHEGGNKLSREVTFPFSLVRPRGRRISYRARCSVIREPACTPPPTATATSYESESKPDHGGEADNGATKMLWMCRVWDHSASGHIHGKKRTALRRGLRNQQQHHAWKS